MTHMNIHGGGVLFQTSQRPASIHSLEFVSPRVYQYFIKRFIVYSILQTLGFVNNSQ